MPNGFGGSEKCVCATCGDVFKNHRALSKHLTEAVTTGKHRQADELRIEGHDISYGTSGYVHASECPACLADDPSSLKLLADEVATWINEVQT